MTSDFWPDPVGSTILHRELGPLLRSDEVRRRLTELPRMPNDLADASKEVRRRYLMRVRDFHIPALENVRLHETIDSMVRASYDYRDPALGSTMASLSGESKRRGRSGVPVFGAAVVGASGSGKTEAVRRCLGSYPSQVVEHREFPRLIGKHRQVVWLSVNAPPSGKAIDLARSLMIAWHHDINADRFADLLSKDRLGSPLQALEEWRQVAMSHFLGVLHLDEVQNFFKLSTLAARRRQRGAEGMHELSIVEDQSLRWVLDLLNTWGIPIVFSGTPDGIGALTRRFSTLQRLCTGGYHELRLFEKETDPDYAKVFLVGLWRYQFLREKLPMSEGASKLILELSGGVRRIIVTLWIAAQRIAFERQGDELRLNDFTTAANTLLAPLAPAVAILRSRDPWRMSRYEDMVPRDPRFWEQVWGGASTA